MFQTASGTLSTDWFSPSATTAMNAAFANVLSTVTGPASSGSSDPLAQLTELVQNGTPIATIADRIAQNLSASLQRQLSGKLAQPDIDRIRSSITNQLAQALAPPGNAPPGTPQQQVTALATQLRNVIETVARRLQQQDSGQQNEIAGRLLDADSAKEIPAQTGTKAASTTIDVSSLVSSLLSSAVSALTAAPAHSGRHADPLKKDPTPERIPQGASPTALSHQTSLPSLAPVTNDLAKPSPLSMLPASVNSPAETSATPQQVPSPATPAGSASDLLARMLVRAAGVDAQINGATAASGTNAASSNTQSSNALLARFEALIANNVAGGGVLPSSSSNSSFANGQSGNPFDQGQLTSQPSTPTHDTSSNSVVAPFATASIQAQTVAAQAGPAAAHVVDANAVIEQMIKSMVMRTNAQGTSEIRLHLQPENLGDVSMKITVSGSQISASVVASNADVRNTLLSNHQQLARSLSNAGLTLSGFSVDVSGGNAGQQQQQQNATAGFGRRYILHELPGAPASEAPAIAALGPPLLNGSSLALFNYLA
jgi:flagellar hook-length control protein FliK